MVDKTNVPVKHEPKTIRRWDPFDGFPELQDVMARFWNETWPFAMRPASWTAIHPPAAPTAYVPRIDVYEKNGNIVIKADLPGTKAEDVDVTVEDGDLIIRGERKAEKEVKEEDYYRMERSYGGFYRRQPLPQRDHAVQGPGNVHERRPRGDDPEAEREEARGPKDSGDDEIGLPRPMTKVWPRFSPWLQISLSKPL